MYKRQVRVDIDKLDTLMNLVSELIIAKNGLVSINNSTSENTVSGRQNFNEQIEYLERVTTSLHESVMNVRMVPIETVVNRFPRMIRDLSKKLDKKMELYMTGEETELDRTVIDEIGDPLMHLSLIHISEPTRRTPISYAVFCLKKKKNTNKMYRHNERKTTRDY